MSGEGTPRLYTVTWLPISGGLAQIALIYVFLVITFIRMIEELLNVLMRRKEIIPLKELFGVMTTILSSKI